MGDARSSRLLGTRDEIAVAPNPGYEAEVEDQSADRFRVRFGGEDDDSRTAVRVRGGEVEHTIS